MEQRAGLEDALLAFAIVSGVIAIADMVQRRQNAVKAEKRQSELNTRLKNIELGVSAVHARLTGK